MIEQPLLQHQFELHDIFGLSTTDIGSLKNNLTSVDIEYGDIGARESDHLFTATFMFDDTIDPRLTDAVVNLVNKKIVGRISIDIAPMYEDGNRYLVLDHCKLISANYSLNYSKSGIARWVVKFNIGSITRAYEEKTECFG